MKVNGKIKIIIMQKKPKGTKDIFGKTQIVRKHIFDVLNNVMNLYGYSRIDTPIFEHEEVFSRTVGSTTDIVQKEMYQFKDKKGRKLVLRPEGTAGVVRAIVENKLFLKLPYRVSYQGPMFRYENPQKGRQRQFTQFGIELIDQKDPFHDAEVILMASLILKKLNIKAKLYINSVGNEKERESYLYVLKEYFKKHKRELTALSQKRIDSNPLRILDDRIDSKTNVVKNAPKISEHYSLETKQYFQKLISFLESMKINYEISDKLVRGLDYYSDTIFEFKSLSNNAGAQDTLIGGGRYEKLLSQFGGPQLGGVGFAIGIERIVNELNDKVSSNIREWIPDVYLLNISENYKEVVASIAHLLRIANISVDWNLKPKKLQKALQLADKSGTKIKVIAGEKELKFGKVVVKIGPKNAEIKISELANFVEKKLKEIG